MDSCTSILLVGKPGHMRDALAGLIGNLPIPNAPRLFCACDWRHAVELTRENPPSVILLAGTPVDDAGSVAALGEIRLIAPNARCLVLTETMDPQAETRFPSADAVLPIGAPFDRLKATIEWLLTES